MPAPTTTTRQISNFGRNVRYRADAYYEPADEQDVLEILRRHTGEQIRVVGSLHSWSDAIRGDSVVISLKKLNGVEFHENEDGATVNLGAGCQIKRALSELRRCGDWTLPAIGLITAQTIAGAISTGTHGSGNHSLSHHVQQVRVAIYDADTGEPKIVTIESGPDLRAARCSLGCLGVILSVRFHCRREYHVGELNKRYDHIDDILAREPEAPLQHFFLLPHHWTFIAQHRQIVEPDREPLRRLDSWLYFVRWFLFMDIGLHLIMSFLARLLPSRFLIRQFFRRIVPHSVPQGRIFIGRSDQVLTWENELFRHIEMEFFVQREHLEAAVQLLTEVLKVFDGQADEPAQTVADQLRSVGLLDRLYELQSSYTHHYPICIRCILPDDTMISMSSGEQDWYSVSLISLQRSHDTFQSMADFVAMAVTRLFDGRLHWGKYFPLDGEYARAAYPELGDFAGICRKYDPGGVFQNGFTREILSEAGPADAPHLVESVSP